MSCGATTGSIQKRLTAFSATQAIEWFTGWVPCVGMDTIMPVLKCKVATSSDFDAQVVLQVAKVRTSEPSTPVTVGDEQSPTSGSFEYNAGSQDISSHTDDAMFVRFGVQYKHDSGGSQAAAELSLEVAYHQCGTVSGAINSQLTTTTSTAQFVAATPWLPALLVEKVKGAATCGSLSGNFQWRLVYRTAATSLESPSGWSVVSDLSAPYTSGDVNTGDLSVTLTGKMWVQFGVQYVSTSGDGQASLACVVGTRRS